jgi:outer membrane protein assembly factor BamB
MRRIGVALTALAVPAMLLVACGGHADGAASTRSDVSAATVVGGDWQRFDYDAQRSGVGPASTGIDAGTVGSLQTRAVHIDGTVDSSAIELSNVTVGGRARDVSFVTTTYGKTIAIDPSTGAKLWEYVPGDLGAYQGSYQITTATPIADPNRRHIYAATPNGRIHKLAVATGAEVHSGHWPVRVTFDARREKIASALNISGRSLIVATGGYIGDAPPYQGHVVMIDLGSGHITHVWNALCANRHHLIDPPRSCPASDGAIWARAGAVVEPGTHRLLVATGNAPFNGSTNWGDSVLELAPGAGRLLHNWTPRNQAQMSADDTDVGSTAPAVLPKVRGYRLAVQGGKDGQLHLLNLNRLNGTRGGAGRRLGGEVEDVSSPGGGEVFTAPAVWSSGRRVYVFVADDSGTAAYVLSVGRRPRLVRVWQNASSGTSPIVAGGLLYVYDEQGGALNIYNPSNGARRRSLVAAGGHWNSPIAVGGRIILPTGDANDHSSHGSIFIYHLPGR